MNLFRKKTSGTSGMKRPNNINITISSTGGSSARQFMLNKSLVKFFLVVISALVLCFLTGCFFLGYLLKEARTTQGLRSENLQLKQQLLRLNELEERLTALNQAKANMLNLLGIDEPLSDRTHGATEGDRSNGYTGVYVPVASGTQLMEGDIPEIKRTLLECPLLGPKTRDFGLLDNTGIFHTGVDIAGETGAGVFAAGQGIVSFIGNHGLFGLVIKVAHSPGLETMYGHTSKILVKTGDFVTAGQVIAEVGNSGQSTAPHLHFEIQWKGKAVDPVQIITDWDPSN